MPQQTSQIPSKYKSKLQHILVNKTPLAPRALVYCSQKMRLFLFYTLLLLTGYTPSMAVGSLLPKPVLLKAQATRYTLTLWWAPPSIQQRAESSLKPGRTAGPHLNPQSGGVQRQTQRVLQDRVEQISRFEAFLVRNDEELERVSLAIDQQSNTFRGLGGQSQLGTHITNTHISVLNTVQFMYSNTYCVIVCILL